MTRDEVKAVIAEAISGDGWADRGPDGDAESVLAALAAAGLVIGERAELTEEQEAIAEVLVDGMYMSDIAEKFGLALVRVVSE